MPSPYELAFAGRLPGLDDESFLRTLVTVTANPDGYSSGASINCSV